MRKPGNVRNQFAGKFKVYVFEEGRDAMHLQYRYSTRRSGNAVHFFIKETVLNVRNYRTYTELTQRINFNAIALLA